MAFVQFYDLFACFCCCGCEPAISRFLVRILDAASQIVRLYCVIRIPIAATGIADRYDVTRGLIDAYIIRAVTIDAMYRKLRL